MRGVRIGAGVVGLMETAGPNLLWLVLAILGALLLALIVVICAVCWVIHDKERTGNANRFMTALRKLFGELRTPQPSRTSRSRRR